MGKSTDVSALAAYGGDYQNQLIRHFYNSFDAAKDLTVIPNVVNSTTLSKIKVTGGAKPYTGVHNPKGGDFKFTERKLVVEAAQRDLLLDPRDYKNTWMGKQLKNLAAGNKEIPFAQDHWESLIAQEAGDINDRSVYFGQGKAAFSAYAGGTAYTVGQRISFNTGNEIEYFRCIVATTAGQTPLTNPEKWLEENTEAIVKGLGKIIATEISGGAIKTLTSGVVDKTTSYDVQTALWRSMHPTLRKRKLYIYQSWTDYFALLDNLENGVYKYIEIINGVTYLAKTGQMCIVKPVSWMGDSRRLICTPDGNLTMGTANISDMGAINIIEDVYTIRGGLSFGIGYEIADTDAMKTTEQV